MEVFEETPARKHYFDETIRLFCTITHSRIQDKHTEYMLKVQRGYNKDNTWTLFKRYNEFVELHRSLKASYYDINLPPKKFWGNLDRDFIKERQQKLQKYINRVLDHIVLSASYHLKEFLDPKNYDLSIHDSEFQAASGALRGSDFHNFKTLSDIGWRFKKNYCSVKKLNESRREYVVTWIGENGIDKCLNDKKELQSAFKVLQELSHPYIMPIVYGNYGSAGALIIRTLCSKGSLRDWIYRTKSPFDSFLLKWRNRDERLILPSVELSTIAIQVLHALAFLHKKNIPYGNLHTGNIFIEDNVAKISDIENGIFGLPSFYKRFLIENRKISTLEDVDVYCFGHVLYEMAFGERLQTCFCDSELLDCYENLRPVLKLILSSFPENKLPCIKALLESNAFSSGSIDIKFENQPYCKITSHTKELMQKCKKRIGDRLNEEQTELRKHMRIIRLQEKVEAEEKFDCTVKIKRKSSKKSQPIEKIGPDNFENMSNSSTRTSLSTDSSLPNSACDKSNETDSIAKTSSAPATPSVPESNDRSALFQSIVNFNKGKLKKATSNEVP